MNTTNFYTKRGIVCPRLGVGCFAYGDAPNQWGANISEDQAVKIMLQLYKRGLRVFDTADVYGFRKEHASDPEKDGFGESEHRLGQVIKEVGRENLFIATKGGRYRGFSDAGMFPQKPHERNFDPAYIREAFEQSCQRLGTDYIDLYQLHGPQIKTVEQKEQAFAALQVLMDIQCDIGPQRLRYVGVSVNDVSEALWYLDLAFGGRGPDVIQIPYNMFQYKDAQQIFERAEKEGVAIIAREPLAKGFLAGKKGKYTHDAWNASSAFPGTIRKYLKRVARGMGNDPKQEACCSWHGQ